MKPAPVFKQKFTDANGVPLAGGFVYTYIANTATPLGTYSTQGGAANQNPVELDGNGEADIWFDPALSYKVTLTDSDDVPIWTVDEVSVLVDSDQLADDAVTEDKIEDDAVTTDKILDEAVTQAKRADLGEQISSACTSWTNDTSTPSDVTNLTVTITTTGRPVWVGCQSSGGGVSHFQAIATGTVVAGEFYILRDVATEVAHVSIGSVSPTGSIGVIVPPGSLWGLDTTVAAGIHVYKVQGKMGGGNTTQVSALNVKLVAYEL